MTQECEKCKEHEQMLKFLENVSLVLGMTHGAIHEILKGPSEEIIDKLTDLFHKLSKQVQGLYYPDTKPN
jgi:hypothetical protein